MAIGPAVPLTSAIALDGYAFVTPIEPLDGDRPAYRDVLVVTRRQKTEAP